MNEYSTKEICMQFATSDNLIRLKFSKNELIGVVRNYDKTPLSLSAQNLKTFLAFWYHLKQFSVRTTLYDSCQSFRTHIISNKVSMFNFFRTKCKLNLKILGFGRGFSVFRCIESQFTYIKHCRPVYVWIIKLLDQVAEDDLSKWRIPILNKVTVETTTPSLQVLVYSPLDFKSILFRSTMMHWLHLKNKKWF